MPRNLSEADRKKNQFDKDERVHLLAIMKQYAPLLEKSASTLARKKIWTTIEDEFKKAGFTSKTSAQLKKYWQNYKYHCKKATTFGKQNKRYVNSEVSESLEWNRYQVLVENRSTTKFSEIPEVVGSLTDHLQTSPTISGCQSSKTYANNGGSSWKLNTSDVFIDLSRVKVERNDDETMSNDCKQKGRNTLKDINLEEDSLEEKKEIFAHEDHRVSLSSSSPSSSSSSSSPSSLTNATEMKSKNRIVVSNAKISNNSVTVSVIYPENDNAHIRRNAIDRSLKLRSSSVSVPTKRTANTLWDERTNNLNRLNPIKTQGVNSVHAVAFGYHDLMKHNRDRSTLNDANPNSEEYKSLECNPNHDLLGGKEIDEMESDENDASDVRAKSLRTRNDRFESRGYIFLSDYHNRLKHRLLLQQLETEEKRLKVKIAEMAIQEVQLRIKALNEDMRRTEELHRLRLMRTVAENRNGNVNVNV